MCIKPTDVKCERPSAMGYFKQCFLVCVRISDRQSAVPQVTWFSGSHHSLSKANGTVVKFVSDKLQWSLYNDTRRWDAIGRVPFLYVIDTTIQPHRSSSIASPNQTDHTLLGSDSLRYHPIGGNSLHKLNYYTTRQYVTQDARTYII